MIDTRSRAAPATGPLPCQLWPVCECTWCTWRGVGRLETGQCHFSNVLLYRQLQCLYACQFEVVATILAFSRLVQLQVKMAQHGHTVSSSGPGLLGLFWKPKFSILKKILLSSKAYLVLDLLFLKLLQITLICPINIRPQSICVAFRNAEKVKVEHFFAALDN